MPSLCLGFDCRFYSKWKPNRISRLVQKIGRLLRRDDGKPDSHYYYARDITDFYNARNGAGRRPPAPLDLGVLDAEANEGSPVDLADDEDSEEATQVFVAGALAAAEDERDDVTLQPITTEVVTIEATIETEIDAAPLTPSTKRVRLRKQMLYVLRDVRGHTIEKTFPFEKLFQSKSDGFWDHMQEEARKGGPRPAWKTRENEALHNYKSQQPEKYKILVTINPEWAEIRGEKNQKELLRMAETGQPKPKQGTPLGNAFNNYRRSNPEFYAGLIEISPDWGIGRNDSFAQQFERIRELGLNGEPRPARGSSDGHFLGNLMRTRPKKYWALLDEAPSLRTKEEQRRCELRQLAQTGARRPLSATPNGIAWSNDMQKPANPFTQEILKIRPDWGATDADRTQDRLRDLARSNAPLPARSTPEGMALANLKKRNRPFYDEIIELNPAWDFDARRLVKANLMALARSAAPRPEAHTTLGQALTKISATNRKFYARLLEVAPHWTLARRKLR